MKLFKNDICYVEFKDLIEIGFPEKFNYDKEFYEENEYVVFTDEKDINYIKNREDIIDYDTVCFLSNEELDNKISEIEHELEPLYLQISSTSKESKKNLFEDEEFKNTLFKLDKIYYDLIHYRNNKTEEDEKILSVLSENNITKNLIRI